jgi:hypothetical protein
MGCGGIGGIIYKVVKIVVVAVASFYGGPLGAAAASAMFTLAEGGSFKEALISGAIAGVAAAAGSAVGNMVSAAGTQMGVQAGSGVSEGFASASLMGGPATFNQAVQQGATGYVSGYTGQTVGNALSTGIIQGGSLPIVVGPGSGGGGVVDFGDPNPGVDINATDSGNLITSLNEPLPSLPQGITKGIETVKSFAEPITGPLEAAVGDGAEYWNTLADKTLGDVLPKFVAQQLPRTPAELIGTGARALTTWTVGEALRANLEGLGPALEDEGGLPPGGFAQLTEIDRRAQIAIIFNRIVDEQDNPFLQPGQEEEILQQSIDEYKAVLAKGLDLRNQALGPDITQEQFDASFNQPELGGTLLGNEQTARQKNYTTALNEQFPGNAFEAIDDNIISSIVDERRGESLGVLSNFEARGNLNPLGGKTANEYIESQRPDAIRQVEQAAQGVGAGNQQALFDIRDEGAKEISDYRLGDEAFDPAPFGERRSELLGTQTASLAGDVRDVTKNRPLFNTAEAINLGGRSQGLVSGGEDPLLNTLADRERTNRNKRTLGSRGSGSF